MHSLNYWVYFAPITPAFCSLLPNIPKILLAKLAHPYSHYGLPFVHVHHMYRSICVQKCSHDHSFIYPFRMVTLFWCRTFHINCSISTPGPEAVATFPNVPIQCTGFIPAQQLHVACFSTFTLNFVAWPFSYLCICSVHLSYHLQTSFWLLENCIWKYFAV